MAFQYTVTPTTATKTPTYQSKQPLVKSFLVDINGGSLGESGVTYTLGYLPKDAQVLSFQYVCITAVTGAGPITASTVVVQVNGQNVVSGANAFATGQSNTPSVAYTSNFFTTGGADNDQAVTYTFTHTGGTTPSTGRFFVHLTYVV